MAVLKIACPRCGQRVSGDESFYGNSVDCPVCSSKIIFPEKPVSAKNTPVSDPVDDLPKADEFREIPDDLPQRAETPIALQPDTPKRREKAPRPPKAELEEDDEDFHEDDHYDDEPPSPLLGIVSMVAGILNMFTGCLLSLILSPVGIICGHLALSRAPFSPVQPAPGRGMAIAGLILGYLGMFVLLIILVLTSVGIIPNPLQGTPDLPASP